MSRKAKQMTEFMPAEPVEEEVSPEKREEKDFDVLAKKYFLASANNPNHVKWRKQAAEDFDFVPGGSGDDSGQWTKEDLAKLKAQKRPIITMNRIEPLIEGIVGTEVNNRQEVSFKPREDADKPAAEVIMEVGKWARDNDVEEEESDMFRNALVCGMGWTAHNMDYSQDLDGKYTVISTDPLSHYWDVDARRSNLSDARWVGYVENMSRDKFQSLFPKEKGADNIFGISEIPTEDEGRASKTNTDYDDPALTDIDGGNTPLNVQVLEFQCYKMESVYRILPPGGEDLGEPLDRDEFMAMRQNALSNGFLVVRFGTPIDPDPETGQPVPVFRYLIQERRVYYRKFYSGGQGITPRERNAWRNGFTFLCMTARKHHRRKTWYGLVRPMKDPQRLTNSFMSAAIHHYNSNPKGGVMYENDAMENPGEMEAKIAHPSPSIELLPGGLSKIKMIDPAPASQALDRLLQLVMDIPPLVTGVSMEFIGLAGRDQPVGLEQTRKLATMSIVSPIFSSYRKYRKQSGRLLFDYMKDYIPEKTMFRVVSEGARKAVYLIKSTDTLKYDIHVDDAPLSPSVKATAFSVMKDFSQFLFEKLPPAAQIPAMKAFFRHSPLSSKLVAELEAAMDAGMKPDPIKKIGQILELKKLAAESMEKESKAELNEAKADTESMKSFHEEQNTSLKLIDQFLNLEIVRLQTDVKNQAAGSAK